MPNPVPARKYHLNKFILIGILCLGLFLLLVLAYSLRVSYNNSISSQPIVFTPQGQLMFSVGSYPLNTDTYGSIVSINYDFVTHMFSIPNPDPPGMLEYQYRMVSTTSRPWFIFVRATGLSGLVNDITTLPFEVYRTNLHLVTWSHVDEKIDSAEQVSNNPKTVKLFPEISEKADVVYMARPTQGPNGTDADGWTIHYVPNKGADSGVAKGVYPKWVYGDKFMFVKNTGLFTYDVGTGDITRVWQAPHPLSDSDMLYVSDDANYVALTIPQEKKVVVFGMLNGDTDTLTLLGAVENISGMYPLISHDDRYIAIESRTVTPAGEEIPIVSFIDIPTLQIIPSATFSLEGVYAAVSQNVATYVASTSPGHVYPSLPTHPGINSQYIVLTNWVQTDHNH